MQRRPGRIIKKSFDSKMWFSIRFSYKLDAYTSWSIRTQWKRGIACLLSSELVRKLSHNPIREDVRERDDLRERLIELQDITDEVT